MVDASRQYQGICSDDEVVLTYGMTGTGKSTMINSLLHGPEALEVVKVNHEISHLRKNGQIVQKKLMKRVIDLKPAYKDNSDCTMKIGHSTS